MIDWSSLTASDFEQFCAELLSLNGFENIEWYGKGGGDKGRDIVATKADSPLPGVRRFRSWVVQCRRYTKKAITKSELADLLAAAREHKPDVVLLILTATLSSDLRDWLKSIAPDYAFEIYTWEERDLEQEVRRHRSKLILKPKTVPQDREPLWFSEMTPGSKVYMSSIGHQFEEVGFYLLNSYGPARDKQIMEDFVEFIRHNDVRFFGDEEEDDEKEDE